MPDYINLPEFIDQNAETIVRECLSYYEFLSNKTLLPAQAETLILKTFAYREQLVRAGVNDLTRQMFLDFSRAPMLDFLGSLLSVVRIPAQSAEVTINFVFTMPHATLVLPQGLRVQSADGSASFYTKESTTVASGVTNVDIICVATNTGGYANGYATGTITTILDPQPYLATASNVTISNGGSDQESDDQLRGRIKLAPNQFSVAGPKQAYIFFAKSASPLIVDVELETTAPGQLTIYPLVLGGATPSPILDAVEAILSDEKVRPLNDEVIVVSPSTITDTLEVEIVAFNSADDAILISTVTSALQEFQAYHRSKLGVDATKSMVNALAMIKGSSYSVEVIHPAADIVANLNQYINFASITVNIVGHTNG